MSSSLPARKVFGLSLFVVGLVLAIFLYFSTSLSANQLTIESSSALLQGETLPAPATVEELSHHWAQMQTNPDMTPGRMSADMDQMLGWMDGLLTAAPSHEEHVKMAPQMLQSLSAMLTAAQSQLSDAQIDSPEAQAEMADLLGSLSSLMQMSVRVHGMIAPAAAVDHSQHEQQQDGADHSQHAQGAVGAGGSMPAMPQMSQMQEMMDKMQMMQMNQMQMMAQMQMMQMTQMQMMQMNQMKGMMGGGMMEGGMMEGGMMGGGMMGGGMMEGGMMEGGMMGGGMMGGSADSAQSAPLVDSETPELSATEEMTRTESSAGVTVKISPIDFGNVGGDELAFDVVLDTHTVDLGVDLAAMSFLQVGETEVAATSWATPKAGGHHVQGVLTFAAKDAQGVAYLDGASTFTLVINGLAGTATRTFTWTLGDN